MSFFVKAKNKIQVYPSFLVLLLILIALGYLEQFFIMFFCVTIHELTHIFFSIGFGLRVEKIIFTPLGEIAIIKDMDFLSPIKKLIIVTSGPMMNFVLWLLCSLLFPDEFIYFGYVNLCLCIFNLLPIYPLDGGRFIQIIIGNRYGVMNANGFLKQMGKWAAFVLIGLGVLQLVFYPYNISLLCLGIYLAKLNTKEYIHMTFQFYKTVITKNGKLYRKTILPLKSFVISKELDIKKLINLIAWDTYLYFYVSENGEITNTITEQDVINHVMKFGIHGNVDELLSET